MNPEEENKELESSREASSAAEEAEKTAAKADPEARQEEHPAEDDSPAQDAGAEQAEEEEEEGAEEEFDLEAQVFEFRRQIEEDPENCIHHYNLGEALADLGVDEEAHAEFQLALGYDADKEFSAIIHFGIGNLHYNKLISGIQSTVVKSSVGLHSAHKAGDTITEVRDEDYEVPIGQFESANKYINSLNADPEIVDYVSQNAPQQIANIYYKWGSDLLDKARQIDFYGSEIKDVKEALSHLKKTLEIDPNHSQANLMIKYGKKMLQEGFKAFDEYGFEAKDIKGTG